MTPYEPSSILRLSSMKSEIVFYPIAGKLSQAYTYLQKALTLDPRSFLTVRKLGQISEGQRRYREAETYYNR